MKKSILFYFLLFSIICLFVEISSFFGLMILRKFKSIEYTPIFLSELSQHHQKILRDFMDGRQSYVVLDPHLGWTIKKSWHQNGYKVNDEGLRADRNYGYDPPPGKIRLAAFGDSFTHGKDVQNHETWTSRLDEMSPELEVLNFGVGAYGPGQTFLRFKRDGIKFNPDIVLIGFMNENIHRVVNVFRPFYFPDTEMPFSKPRFKIMENELVLFENPLSNLEDYEKLFKESKTTLKRLANIDYYATRNYQKGRWDLLPSVRLWKILCKHYKGKVDPQIIFDDGQFNPDSEAFRVLTRLFDNFYEDVVRMEMEPIIILFPDNISLAKYVKDGIKVYAPLIDYFSERKYSYLDLLDIFKDRLEENGNDFFNVDHYNVFGNQVVAEAVYNYLKQRGRIK